MLKKSKLLFTGMILTLSFIGCKATTDDGGAQPPVFVQYIFHDSVTTLSGEDKNGSYGTEGDYVLFGDFPQNVVPENKVDWLGLEKSTTKLERGYMEFVQGLDGNYYVKCTENAYSDNYKYLDNSDVKQGSTTSRWFKVMPIKWRVAATDYDIDGATGSETAKLLVAENILTANVPYYESQSTRTISDSKVYPNNYRHSQIRAYLNGLTYKGYDTTNSTNVDKTQWYDSVNSKGKGFLQAAFGQTAIAAIKDTVVDNSKDSTTDKDGKITKAITYACNKTTDKIFLLSEYEVTKYSKESYDDSGLGNSRIRVTTDFAKANYAYQSTSTGYGGYWWLRSPYHGRNDNVRHVYDGGDAGHEGGVSNTFRGVVPALSISF